MEDTEGRARQSGYLSEDAKRKFTLVAGVLGALFFVLQIAIPMGAVVALMPAMMWHQQVTTFDLDGSALHQGQIYLVESTRGLDTRDKPTAVDLARVSASGVERVASLGGWEPNLLSDGSRLWLVSSARMAIFEDGQVRRLDMPERLGDISRPFLLEGAPAVVESRPEGQRLMAWRDGRFLKLRDVRGLGDVCCFAVLPTSDDLLAVRQQGQSLFARSLDRAEAGWEAVASNVRRWNVFRKDGQPAVASLGSTGGLHITDFDGAKWKEVGTVEAGFATMGVAAFQSKPGGPLTLLSEGLPGSLDLRTWERGHVVARSKIAGFSPFPRGMMTIMWLPHLGSLLMSLLLAVILSSLMRTHRIAVYVHDGREVAQASLTRRALSQLVDAALLAGPVGFFFFRMFTAFEDMVEKPSDLLWLFGFLGGSLAWALMLLLLFGVTEGLWGVTPGKLLLGIRVVGTDLAPCGIGRGIVRNVLKLADGFFNFLIGILMVAFTPDWQRIGDMAARTIVVRAPRGIAALRG
jgi:uncharacterized RDD family membrane protein YckC